MVAFLSPSVVCAHLAHPPDRCVAALFAVEDDEIRHNP